MKSLTIVRHAKSSWEERGLSDRERPLNKRGNRDAPIMGQRVAAAGIRPSQIISSPAVRAWATAKAFARELNYPVEFLQREHGLYLASLDNLLRGDDWEALAHYMLSRSAEHGVRRAEEMREAATTVRDAGIEPWMSLATVERQQWIAGFTNALGRDTLAGLLDQVLAEVNENSREPAR